MRLVFLFLFCAAILGGATPRPNIVLILADDLGYGDIGCYGGKAVPTPHIDRLAREGVRFTDGYVTSPACAPSRLGLMAGAFTQRFGVTWNDDRSAHKLPDTQRLLPELLRDAGYVTGLIGKWNIVRPAERCFDEVHNFIEWESDYFPQEDGRYKGSNTTKSSEFGSSKTAGWGPERPDQEYLTDRLGRHATDFIRRHATHPFFLYVGFNAVHSPWHGRKSDQQRFAHLPHEVLRIYASMVAALDENVGRILDTLRAQKLEENTLVVFLSDNGPAKGSAHIAGWKPDWPKHLVVGSAGPLRGAKTDLYDGGIREPFILRWPARLAARRTFVPAVTAMDLLPTLCVAAGATIPNATTVDGVNLLPFLRGERSGPPHDALFWKIKSAAAVRSGDWKLVMVGPEWKPELYNLPSDPATWRPQLYNLANDIGETRDVASANPDVVRRLHTAWQEWNRPLPPPARIAAAPKKK
ncbi:MAG: sulfatase-like hydrolase/transferase [Opitutaceae bacterium]|nr:sulfatase-like hydrolase/transferase [Opitutaceae bacterium]